MNMKLFHRRKKNALPQYLIVYEVVPKYTGNYLWKLAGSRLSMARGLKLLGDGLIIFSIFNLFPLDLLIYWIGRRSSRQYVHSWRNNFRYERSILVLNLIQRICLLFAHIEIDFYVSLPRTFSPTRPCHSSEVCGHIEQLTMYWIVSIAG